MLTEITEQQGVLLDIRYATADNVTEQAFYRLPKAFLHEEAKVKLEEAVRLAAIQGLKIKIFDAFRPLEAQQVLWNHSPDPEFVSHPEIGSCPHCRGVAVDIILTDAQGNELEMGTGFDDFTPSSHHGNTDISVQAQHNRYLLMGIMLTAGWDFYRNEWWHYQLFNPRNYPKWSDAEAKTGLIYG